MFCHNGLINLSLYNIPSGSCEAPARYSLGRLGQDIAFLAPRLTSLSLSVDKPAGGGYIQRWEEDIESFLLLLQDLVNIRLSPCMITAGVIAVLSGMPHLRSATSCILSPDEKKFCSVSDVGLILTPFATPEFLHQPIFLCLTSITLCGRIDQITELLTQARFPARQLERTFLRFIGSTSPVPESRWVSPDLPNSMVFAFFEAFVSFCTSDRHALFAFDRPTELIHGDEELIDAHTLSPLRRAVGLRSLVIRDQRPLSAISEDDLVHLLQPLVRLRSLWLIPCPDWPDEGNPPISPFTMATVGRIVQALPRLLHLGLYLDLCYEIQEWQGATTGPLMTLFVGTSPCPSRISENTLGMYMRPDHFIKPLQYESWREWGLSNSFYTPTDMVYSVSELWSTTKYKETEKDLEGKQLNRVCVQLDACYEAGESQ